MCNNKLELELDDLKFGIRRTTCSNTLGGFIISERTIFTNRKTVMSHTYRFLTAVISEWREPHNDGKLPG